MLVIKKYIFITLAIIGVLIISICAFILPNNPNEMIKALTPMTFERPLWLNNMIGGSFIYLIILDYIYDKLNKESGK